MRPTLIAVLALAAPAALAQPVNHLDEYVACLDLVREQPEQAYESARVWYGAGGADAAWHCAGLALLRLGEYDKAARALEAVAEHGKEVGRQPPGSLWGQVADAWRLAGKPKRAEDVIRAAAERDPEDLELKFEWARLLVETGRAKQALAAIEAARLLRYHSSTLAVKAAALYRIGRPLDALATLEEALVIEPANPWGRLVRARMLRAGRELERAKADYATIIEAHPAQPVAVTARAELAEILETGK